MTKENAISIITAGSTVTTYCSFTVVQSAIYKSLKPWSQYWACVAPCISLCMHVVVVKGVLEV